MGVPKFFRYISERYPCLSELVKEYQIPEFDNLYLDMNGIIHMCSHPDDNNPHFRITEEKIFKDVFHYIEVLFRMIRPQKLFFMAVDGVAPRAKMNQQRGRRFRSAKDAEKQENDAKKKGEVLPEQARFDSNCITPGTVFMAKLHEQLKYFIVQKISSDPSWQKCKVILSGHETPGEGEHKIMDYIRYMRAQPGYDPNTRHCLYGLDADLIMLGLCTHEPHFSLLREEVKFGRKSTKRMNVPEEITFYLLHLSLMREYLELEFAPLKNKLQGFEYDFEKIIDDWVLMGFLVGNDFIPHLPNLHIANGALPLLYKAYMDILPTLDGYINESGTLNLPRFEKFMQKLADIDIESFAEIKDEIDYMEQKTGRKWNAHPKVSTRHLEEWKCDEGAEMEPLEPEKPRDSGLSAMISRTEEMFLDSEEDETEQSDEDDAFKCYKRDYYRNKLEYVNVTPEVMRDQAEGYVRAIQWNLNYYYNGCCSWSWYYPHHYAPYISDIKGFSNLKIEFDKGKPFLPYEQLLAVLPSASKNLLPTCYHNLMTDEDSIIKKYYPEDFQTDLNGKKQEWEAVVLVPFIDEKVLLEAMQNCNDQLTPEEKQRNSHGPMLIYTFTLENKGPYAAPEYFPTVAENRTSVTTLNYDDILIPKEKLVKGAYPGVKLDVYYPGFPTMKHLKYEARLKMAKIRVFETPSRNENMIITIINDKFLDDKIPVDLLGKSVWVGWPHLVEAKVVSISNNKRKYVSMGGSNAYNVEERTGNLVQQFDKEVEGITEYYGKRMGIIVGETKVLVHVQVMIGRRYVFTPNGRVNLDKVYTRNISNYPLQAIVFDIAAYDSYHTTFRDVSDVFPVGSSCFTITNPHYGSEGVIQDSKKSLKEGRLKICILVCEEPDFSSIAKLQSKSLKKYKPLYNVANQVGISNVLFSRITGSIFITVRNGEGGLKNVNVGLNLKLSKKNKETPGYTKKIDDTWLYSDKTVSLVREYVEKYPEVVDYLYQDAKFEEIAIESIFKDEWEEKLKELQTWLKSLPTHSIEKVSCGVPALGPEEIAMIEKIVDECQNVATTKKVPLLIKPSFLYKSEIQNGTLPPDPKSTNMILDRIVNVRAGYSVPLGLKGTITSIHVAKEGSDRDTMYDVVFDKPFPDGLKLNCSDGRGYRLPKSALINISYGLRLMEEKSGRPDEVIAKAENSRKNTTNAYNNQQYNEPRQRQQQPRIPVQNQQPYPFNPGQSQFHKENSAFVQFSNASNSNRSWYSNIPFQETYNSPDKNNGREQNYNSPKNYSPQKQPNTRNGNAQKNDFMPRFNNSSRENKGESQKSSPVKQRPRPTPNTDILKTILKIGMERDEEAKRNPLPDETRKNSPQKSASSTSQHPQTQEGTTPNKLFDMFAKAAPAAASVRLLTYYQSNGLGLPRYQYYNDGSFICSQIKLPNGEFVVGKPAKTKEEAIEKVAADVLDIFLNKRQNGPIPVKTGEKRSDQWQPRSKPQNNQEKVSQKPIESQKNYKGVKSTVLNNSFVPLQALKGHINKNNTSTKNAASESVDSKTGLSKEENKHSLNKTKNKVHNPNSRNRSQRKTRIAANFDLLKKASGSPTNS